METVHCLAERCCRARGTTRRDLVDPSGTAREDTRPTRSVKQERERTSDRDGMQPHGHNLHFGVSAGTAGFARHIRVGPEEAVKIPDHAATHNESDDEKGEEDDLDQM